MSADIQVVNAPNLEKIESFLKDQKYREHIEFSANYNSRLRIQRRLRLPFLDSQTGVAQNHSQLFVDKRLRMPGLRQGQLYSYPAQRWRKTRRQYTNKMYRFPDRPFQALRKDHENLVANISSASLFNSTSGVSTNMIPPNTVNIFNDSDFNGTLEESSSLGATGDTSDSKDSQQIPPHIQQQQQQSLNVKEDLPKEWFYDDIDNDVDSLEDPKSPADDEYDYDPRYGNKKRRKRRPGKRATITPGEPGPTRRRGAGRGRSTAVNDSILDESGDVTSTPTGRRPRGNPGTRGRRRTKQPANSACDPPSPGLAEPPSFESVAAAVGVGELEDHADLRNYRKFL